MKAVHDEIEKIKFDGMLFAAHIFDSVAEITKIVRKSAKNQANNIREKAMKF